MRLGLEIRFYICYLESANCGILFLLTWRCISGWFDIFNVFFFWGVWYISYFFVIVYQPTNNCFFILWVLTPKRENIWQRIEIRVIRFGLISLVWFWSISIYIYQSNYLTRDLKWYIYICIYIYFLIWFNLLIASIFSKIFLISKTL